VLHSESLHGFVSIFISTVECKLTPVSFKHVWHLLSHVRDVPRYMSSLSF
jgi:hypothetical protein